MSKSTRYDKEFLNRNLDTLKNREEYFNAKTIEKNTFECKGRL